MAIRNVVCRGYGPGATIAFVATRGYTISAVVTVDVAGRRIMTVPGSARTMTVDSPQRTFTVPAGARDFTVE